MQEDNNNYKQEEDRFPLYATLIGIGIFIVLFLFFFVAGNDNQDIEIPDQYKTKSPNAKEITYESYIQDEAINNRVKFNHKYNFNYEYIIHIEGSVNDIKYIIPLPKDNFLRQKITNRNITPKPQHLYLNDGNIIAEYNFDNLKTGKYTIKISGLAETNNYNINTAKNVNRNFDKETDFSKYLKDEKLIEPNNKIIKNIAAKINGTNREEIVSKIFEYTKKNIEYSTVEKEMTASQTIKKGKGKCSDYAAVMVSLCRAKGIPARIITGNIARSLEQKHTWVEVYFDQYGWVKYDPTIITAYRNYLDNGILVKREKYEIEVKNHIESIKNSFMPWYITYSIKDSKQIGRLAITEKINIKRLK